MTVETEEGCGVLSLALREALFAVAQAAAGNKPGRVAVIRLAGLLSTVEGEGALAERLALLGKPGTAPLATTRGWVARMREAGRLGPDQVKAAATISRAVLEQVTGAAAGLRAVDPSRLVVDGGKLADPQLGGRVVASEDLRAYEAWVKSIRDLPLKRAVVRGKDDGEQAGGLFRDQLVVRVVVDGVAPSAIDRKYLLRNGRSAEVVMVELDRFARRQF